MKTEELKELLASMTRKEKVDQMLQIMGAFYQEDVNTVLTGPASSLGITEEDIDQAGSILGTAGAEALIKIQKTYMERQPHHIPMLFMLDVIHGMKTVFPMPLAQGASFDPELAEKCAAVAAKEAAVSGIHVTFSPMVDLVRDARWGRVMESPGEDPYLNGQMAAAIVKGFQGEDMKAPGKVCACIKHFAAYGGATAGRDYNTVELSEHTLRDFYLRPYRDGIDAGAGMVMTSFNTVNGIPASVNKHLMRDILRKDLGFKGVLISDFAAIQETIAHGCSKDPVDAARKGLEAGVDIDMMTSCYSANLCEMIERNEVDEALVDEAVLRILTLKNQLGLFENPYKDADPEAEKKVILCPEHRMLAREAAAKSFVLLKNDGILPLDQSQKIAFIGPYTDNKEMISSWAIMGNTDDCVTIRQAAQEVLDVDKISFHQGSRLLGKGVKLVGFDAWSQKNAGENEWTQEEENKMLADACEAAANADVVVMTIGESWLQSGEATSRGMLDIPDPQMHLLREVAKHNSNIVVVLFNGRPLDLREISAAAKAVLEVWLPGTEGGHAVLDTLTGVVNPSGKLSMSFPYCVGQCPVYYNEYTTGRPFKEGDNNRFLSKYLDIPNKPLYPFGFGLSYTTFSYEQIVCDKKEIEENEKLMVSAVIKNTGKREGTEVVQLYIQDVKASVVRPVKELKRFKKVTLKPSESQKVSFEIDASMLRFLREDGTVGTEPGEFRVWIGGSSDTENVDSFCLK